VQKDDHDHGGPDKAVVFGKVAKPLMATDKANVGLTVAGESASFRNLRMWEATPKADWAATKGKLSSAKKSGWSDDGVRLRGRALTRAWVPGWH
jgi:hypothetical protein